MNEAYICDFVRTPIGRYAGGLKDVRPDDLAAHVLRVLKEASVPLLGQDPFGQSFLDRYDEWRAKGSPAPAP